MCYSLVFVLCRDERGSYVFWSETQLYWQKTKVKIYVDTSYRISHKLRRKFLFIFGLVLLSSSCFIWWKTLCNDHNVLKEMCFQLSSKRSNLDVYFIESFHFVNIIQHYCGFQVQLVAQWVYMPCYHKEYRAATSLRKSVSSKPWVTHAAPYIFRLLSCAGLPIRHMLPTQYETDNRARLWGCRTGLALPTDILYILLR